MEGEGADDQRPPAHRSRDGRRRETQIDLVRAIPNGNPWRVAVTGGVQSLSDQRTAEQIEKQLAYAKTFDGTCIEVHVYGEDVFLPGLLPSLHAKVEAGLVAAAARGVERGPNHSRAPKPRPAGPPPPPRRALRSAPPRPLFPRRRPR